MKNSFLFTLCTMLFLASCIKDEKLEITMKQSGSLSVTIKDNAGSPIVDEPVFLYDSDDIMDSKKTDPEGVVNFGTLLFGNYRIVLENVEIGSQVFYVSQTVPVTIGNSINLEIIPEEYVGSIVFSAREEEYNDDLGIYEFVAVQNVSVYAVFTDDFTDNIGNIDELINLAVSSGITSADGKAVLEGIPANMPVKLIYYTDNKFEWEFYTGNITLGKYQEFEADVIIVTYV